MQWEYPTADEEVADPAAADEPPADDGLLQAAASTSGAPVAMMAAAIRDVGGRARDGRRRTRVLCFIVPSFGAGRGRAWRPMGSGTGSCRFRRCSVRGGPRRRGP